MSPVRIAVAAAIAASAVAGTANALDITAYAGNTNINTWIAGSTAVDGTLLNAAIETGGPGGLCNPGTIDVYEIDVPAAPSQRLIYCTGSGTSGESGKPIAIFKESEVGSINGPQSIINVKKSQPSGVFFIDPAALARDANKECTVAAVAANGNLGGYTSHTNCNSADVTTNQIPTGGVADVEAGLLRTVPGNAPLNPSDISTFLSGVPGLDVVWGVGVTQNLYYALQHAEGLDNGSVTSACSTANNDASQCAPSLSKEQLAAIFSGNLVTWSQLGLNNTTDSNVYLCRRDDGSGTEASYEAYFMGERCGSSSLTMLAQDGQFVFEENSTGGVRSCLAAFNSGGTVTPFNGDTNPPSSFAPVHEAGGQWAVGVMTSEVSGSQLVGFREVAVDGFLPTLANVINGFYPYFSTDAWYTYKTGQPASVANVTVFNAIATHIAEPAFLKDSNAAFAGRPWGNGGDLSPTTFAAVDPPTIPSTAATAASVPVNAFSKSSSGSVNNCDTPVLNTSLNSTSEATLLGFGIVNH